MVKDNNRGTGVFTTTQREYLINPGRQTDQERREWRYRTLRPRVENALFDAPLLSEFVNDRDLRLLMESDHGHGDGPLRYANPGHNPGERLSNLIQKPERQKNAETTDPNEGRTASPEAQESLIEWVIFAFRMAEAGQVSVHDLIETALERHCEREGQGEFVANIHVQPQTGAANEAMAKMRRGESLRPTEVKALLNEGHDLSEPPVKLSDEELESELRDEATVNDGVVNFDELPVADVDESDMEAVIEVLLSSGVDELAARLIEENDEMSNQIPAHNVVDFLRWYLSEQVTSNLAESAEVTVEEFRLILTEAADEIAHRLSEEYDLIENTTINDIE